VTVEQAEAEPVDQHQTQIQEQTRSWPRTAWLLVGILVLCSWCSLVSGFGGWIMGYDLGRREARASFLPEKGVLVTRVEQGSPAEQAGIVRGDMITGINGVSVDDVVSLRDELMGFQPGERVLITYRHDLGEQITYVSLGQFPGSVNIPYLGIYFTARAEKPADM
jgi:membrane-associated protease RseP (regulator of RpoE activity)